MPIGDFGSFRFGHLAKKKREKNASRKLDQGEEESYALIYLFYNFVGRRRTPPGIQGLPLEFLRAYVEQKSIRSDGQSPELPLFHRANCVGVKLIYTRAAAPLPGRGKMQTARAENEITKHSAP